jgi:hypothetical protein
MMSTAPPLLLNCEQARRLLTYMQAYRRSALTSMPPTQERNTTLRVVQALQGKLLALSEQHVPHVPLSLSREEATALKAMAKSLLLFYGEQTESPDRTITVTDLGKLYVYLKQTSE